jgi:phosphomannomutase
VGRVSDSSTKLQLDDIVKAYDIRGLVPDQLSNGVAAALGHAFAQFCAGEGADRVVVGHDMRASSPGLARAFAAGVDHAGLEVLDAGLAATDLLYYASGSRNLPGAMFTASHNPASYNGVKFCRAGAAPIGQETGLAEIRRLAEAEGAPWYTERAEPRPEAVTAENLLADYASHLRSLVDLSEIRPLTVVVDAGNGMAGYTVPEVLGAGLPLTIIPLYFELDGAFPNHEANPLDPANLVDLQRRVREVGADAGLAFDGDADRCFLVDERGEPVNPSAITALVAARQLAREPGSTVIYNLITSRAVPEIVTEQGGKPVRTRVGHSFIKEEMARTGAIFGGEHSAHYYFRDFWRADTGMLAAMHVLAALGGSDQPLSELVAAYQRYAPSGEINSRVEDAAASMAEVEAEFLARPGAVVDHLDGVTISLEDGSWFNLRPSNTEPLLRLNVEAATPEAMATLRDDVLSMIRRDRVGGPTPAVSSRRLA